MGRISRRALLLLFVGVLGLQAEQLRGRWAATDGKITLDGNWTANLQGEPDVCTGTWDIRNASGVATVRGTWAVDKDGNSWQGRWQARLPDDRTFSGTWTAKTALPASLKFGDLLRSALKETITGGWRALGRYGAWTVRADVAR
jgi:hypothetical protein